MSPRILAALCVALAAPLALGSVGRTTNLDERVLAAHNRERAALGVAPLEWNPQLAADATRYARELAARGVMEHSEDNPDDPDPQGENLWAGTRGHYAPEAMVGLWVDEKKHFRPGVIPAVSTTGNFEDVGHYTQLAWRRSSEVGCGVAAGEEEEFLVCRYAEGGNVEGERPF